MCTSEILGSVYLECPGCMCLSECQGGILCGSQIQTNHSEIQDLSESDGSLQTSALATERTDLVKWEKQQTTHGLQREEIHKEAEGAIFTRDPETRGTSSASLKPSLLV